MRRLLFIFFLFFPLAVVARVTIYIIPEVEIVKKNLTLSDIARIDGDPVCKTGSIIIPQTMYSDFVIDRKELNDFLASELSEVFSVYGNGVKVTFKEEDKYLFTASKEETKFLVKKGETVELIVRNKGISIELTGKSMQNGTKDDEINIRLKNGKILKGKPLEAGKVAVYL